METDAVAECDDLREPTGEEGPASGIVVVAIPGRGKGLVATQFFPRGSLLWEERAALVNVHGLPPEGSELEVVVAKMLEQFGSLSPEMRNRILDLHCPSAGHGSRVAARLFSQHGNRDVENIKLRLAQIYELNAFEVDETLSEAERRTALFVGAARVNHSCRPNLSRWCRELGVVEASEISNVAIPVVKMDVFAQEDITVGEELCFDYVGFWRASAERQRILQAHFGFSCDCVVCRLPSDALEKSDSLRTRYDLLGNSLAQIFHSSSSLSSTWKTSAPAMAVARPMSGTMRRTDADGARALKLIGPMRDILRRENTSSMTELRKLEAFEKLAQRGLQ